MDRSLLALAQSQEQLLSRRQLFAGSVTRATLRAHLSAGRWRSWGRHTIALHSGPLVVLQGTVVCASPTSACESPPPSSGRH